VLFFPNDELFGVLNISVLLELLLGQSLLSKYYIYKKYKNKIIDYKECNLI